MPESIALVFGPGDPKVLVVGADGTLADVTGFVLSVLLLPRERAELRMLSHDTKSRLIKETSLTLPYRIGLEAKEVAI